ncbi:hypothetical protein Tco_1478858 [Tanacetum coccineum]
MVVLIKNEEAEDVEVWEVRSAGRDKTKKKRSSSSEGIRGFLFTVEATTIGTRISGALGASGIEETEACISERIGTTEACMPERRT